MSNLKMPVSLQDINDQLNKTFPGENWKIVGLGNNIPLELKYKATLLYDIKDLTNLMLTASSPSYPQFMNIKIGLTGQIEEAYPTFEDDPWYYDELENYFKQYANTVDYKPYVGFDIKMGYPVTMSWSGTYFVLNDEGLDLINLSYFIGKPQKLIARVTKTDFNRIYIFSKREDIDNTLNAINVKSPYRECYTDGNPDYVILYIDINDKFYISSFLQGFTPFNPNCPKLFQMS